MARWYRFALVSLAALALSSAAWAQPGPGGPPPGGWQGRGFGGFGGFGMFGGGPGGGSLSTMYGFLLNAPTVQKDLELVAEQTTKLKELNEQNQAAMREMFSGMRDFRDLSEEEQRKRREEMGKKMQARAEETRKAIEEILLPHQLERIKGIALQMAGTGALNFKEVQEDLKLSEGQLGKIKSINEEMGKKMREFFTPGQRPDFAKMQEVRKESEKQLLDVLTADQKTQLDKMKGEKLEIPPAEMRGPGGFGPGGPGGERKRPPARKTEE